MTMNRDAIAAALCPRLAALLDRPVTEMTDTASFSDDFGIDSLDAVEIEMMAEEEFDIAFAATEEFPQNIGGLIDRIETRLAATAAKGAA